MIRFLHPKLEVSRRFLRASRSAAAGAARRLASRGVSLARALGHAAGPALGSTSKRARRLLGLESLKVRLAIGSSLVAAAILLVTYWVLSAAARNVAQDQARKRVTELSSYFSGIFAEAVAAGDQMQIHLFARAILDQGVQALSITDGGGKLLFASRPALHEEDIFRTQSVRAVNRVMVGTAVSEGESMIHAAAAVRFGDRPVGVMHIWLNRTDLEDEIQEAHAFIYPILAAGFLLMVLLVVVVLQTPFSALKRLTHAARQIGEGDLSGRVPVKGDDAVAEFSKAFNSMVDGLQEARQVILRRHLEIVEAMISVMEAKDSYTQGHCVRVLSYARTILEQFGHLTSDEKPLIETTALLHDIGKIGIPDSVLLKEQRLTHEEMEIVRNHVTIGEKILLHMDSLKEVARWVRHHHERWDGLGYPDGLRGEAIPFASRVVAVADALDAMLTDRPYRKALSREKAIQALLDGQGTQFDPRIVESAVAILAKKEKEKEAVEVYA